MELLFAVDLATFADVAALPSSESPMDEDPATLLLVSAPNGVLVVVAPSISFKNVSKSDVVPDVVVAGVV